MNIKEQLTCKSCREILNEPITLNCCGENICKKHLSELVSSESSKKTSCPICSSDLDKQGLNVNKLIQSLVENELHKFKIYPKYKELIKKFKSEIEALEKTVKDPENAIYEKFSELKRQVDLEREQTKLQIDRLADDIIEKLVTFEKEFKSNCKTKSAPADYTDLINESKKQLEENEKFMNLFSIENSDREEKSIEIKKIIQNLEWNRNKLEKSLFCNKSFKYKKSSLNVEDYFGKLIVSIIGS